MLPEFNQRLEFSHTDYSTFKNDGYYTQHTFTFEFYADIAVKRACVGRRSQEWEKVIDPNEIGGYKMAYRGNIRQDTEYTWYDAKDYHHAMRDYEQEVSNILLGIAYTDREEDSNEN